MDTLTLNLLLEAICIFVFGIKIAYNIHKNRNQLIEIIVYETFFSLLFRGVYTPFINLFLIFCMITMINYLIFFFRKQNLTF